MSLSRLWRDEEGTVMILAAGAIFVAAGLAAFSVDLSNMYSTHGRLQNAADAAALAAVQKLPEVEEARALAVEFAQKNVSAEDGTVVVDGEIKFGYYNSASEVFQENVEPINAVKVVARRLAEHGNAVPTYFGGIFNVNSMDVEAESIAVVSKLQPCVYILDPSASRSLAAEGSPSLQVRHCSIHVNSNAGNAITTQGNPSVSADSSISAEAICVVGGYESRRGLNPLPETGCDPKPDPLATLPEPTPPSLCFLKDVVIETPLVLPPNAKLCGSIEFGSGAQVFVPPGVLFLEDAHLLVKGTGTINGSDVMLYLDPNSSFEFKSSKSLTWSAPTSGEWAGIAIYQSRSAAEPRSSHIGSSRDVFLTGSIYAPRLDLELGGSALLSIDGATNVVLNTLRLKGSPDIIFDMQQTTAQNTALVK